MRKDSFWAYLVDLFRALRADYSTGLALVPFMVGLVVLVGLIMALPPLLGYFIRLLFTTLISSLRQNV